MHEEEEEEEKEENLWRENVYNTHKLLYYICTPGHSMIGEQSHGSLCTIPVYRGCECDDTKAVTITIHNTACRPTSSSTLNYRTLFYILF